MNENLNQNNDEIKELQGFAQDLYGLPLPDAKEERKNVFKQELKSDLMFEFERNNRAKYAKKRSFSIKIFKIFNHAAVTALALPLFVVGSVGSYAYYSPAVYGDHVLYPVKLSIEKIEYSFAKTPAKQAEKKLKLAKRRLQEIEVATSEGESLDKALLSKVASYTLAAIQDVSEVKSEEKRQDLQKNIEIFAKNQMAVLIDIKDEYEEKKSEYVAYVEEKDSLSNQEKHQTFQSVDNDEVYNKNDKHKVEDKKEYKEEPEKVDEYDNNANNNQEKIVNEEKEQSKELKTESEFAYDKYQKEQTPSIDEDETTGENNDKDYKEISQSEFAYNSDKEKPILYTENPTNKTNDKVYEFKEQSKENEHNQKYIENDKEDEKYKEYKKPEISTDINTDNSKQEKAIGTHDQEINKKPVQISVTPSSDFAYNTDKKTSKISTGDKEINKRVGVSSSPMISVKDKNTINSINKDVEALQYLLDVSSQVQEVNFANAIQSKRSVQKSVYSPRIKFDPSLEEYTVDHNVFLIQSSKPVSFYLSHYFVDSFGIDVPADIYNKPVEIYYTKDNSDPFISETKARYFEGQEILMDRNATLKFVAVVNGEASPTYVVQMNMIRKITNYELRIKNDER